jgi:hypothetical protein
LLSTSFIFALSAVFPQHCKNFNYFVPIQFGIHLRECLSTQEKVEQIIVTQVHQFTQAATLTDRQVPRVVVEEPLQENVVLQHTPAATPPESAEPPLVQQHTPGKAAQFHRRHGVQTVR